jgi:hypothetical protein
VLGVTWETGDLKVDTPLVLEVDDSLRIPVTYHTIADATSLKDAWMRVFHAVEKVCEAWMLGICMLKVLLVVGRWLTVLYRGLCVRTSEAVGSWGWFGICECGATTRR